MLAGRWLKICMSQQSIMLSNLRIL